MPNAQQKGPSTLPSQTGPIEIIPTESIPRERGHIPFSLETRSNSIPDQIGVDSFKGRVAAFRLYLLAQRKLLEVGVLVP